jgi:hypothetical protein
VALAIADRDDISYPALHDVESTARLRWVVHHPEATSIRVVGSWSGWMPDTAMATRIGPGLWEATIDRLSAGRYQYKLVVDGIRWIADPANRQSADDGFGATNSVFTVR